MAIRLSPGLQASILSQYGLGSMLGLGVIEVYSGAQPESAANAPAGTLLARVTQGGDDFIAGTTQGGLVVDYDQLAGGLVNVGEWRLRGVATGAPGWWRWKWNSSDDNSVSLYYPRIDGLVGESLVLTSTAITASTSAEVGTFLMEFLEN